MEYRRGLYVPPLLFFVSFVLFSTVHPRGLWRVRKLNTSGPNFRQHLSDFGDGHRRQITNNSMPASPAHRIQP